VLLGFHAQVERSLEPPKAVSPNHASRPSAGPRVVSAEARTDAIVRAQVWKEPAAGPMQARVPATAVIQELSCRFVLKRLKGTTPKFNCVLGTGEEVRIKYGAGPEIPSEAAATRLLRALGFGADEITLVRHLRCYGCPLEPFAVSKAVQTIGAGGAYAHAIDYADAHDYEWVALERKYHGVPIETPTIEGWAFPELSHIDPAKGGAPRAQVDALRLVSVFLAHWDNKADNQRLVCDRHEWPDGSACPAPFMMLQDLGATFGPMRVDLPSWRATPIWRDRAACTISMHALPYEGGTFPDVSVSEAGRVMAVRLLEQLSRDQLRQLFIASRMTSYDGIDGEARNADTWARVFEDKVRQIRQGGPCPLR